MRQAGNPGTSFRPGELEQRFHEADQTFGDCSPGMEEQLQRRAFIASSASALLAASRARPALGRATDPQASPLALRRRIVERAEALSRIPYAPRPKTLPSALQTLGYDGYRGIRNVHDNAIWRDGPGGFELEPLLRGFIYPERIRVNLVDGATVRRLGWDSSFFDAGDTPLPQDQDIGYSGLRLLTQMGSPPVSREFLVFQGASYFRALAYGLGYGLSARGLALGTGEPGEEFPAFTDFWIEHPEKGAAAIVVHALLDGPSVTGAFMFTIRPGRAPGDETRCGTNVTLFARADLPKAGLAPLTSMYWFGPLERGQVDDYRPQVHDSDGLTFCTGDGDWIWRPLANPRTTQMSSFGTAGTPRGFGLAQRARGWSDYEDIEAGYQCRPGAWVAPHDDWPEGRLVLAELPTRGEFDDNVVLFWRPTHAPRAGDRLDYGYDLVFAEDCPRGVGLMQVVRACSGAYAGDWRLMVVDFAAAAPVAPDHLTPQVETSGGKIESVSLSRVPATGALRLTFRLAPEATTCELRAVLKDGDRAVSETWLYRWTR